MLSLSCTIAESIEIPARSEMIVSGKVHGLTSKQAKLCLTEPTKRMLKRDKGLVTST